MHTRLLIALVLSGTVHAGAFVIGTGLWEIRSTGLNDFKPITTLTVSVVSSMDSTATRIDNKEANLAKDENRLERKHHESRKRVSAHVGGASEVHTLDKGRIKLRDSDGADTNTPSIAAEENSEKPKEFHLTESLRPDPPPETQAPKSDTQVASVSNRNLDTTRGEEFEKTYLMEFLAELSRHKFYPRSAHMGRQEGKVVVSLVIRKDGSIDDVELDKASRFPVLNRAAVQAVERIGKFKPFPPGMDRTTWHLNVPFRYSITDR